MAIQSGTDSNLRAWSLVITVFPAGQYSAIKHPLITVLQKIVEHWHRRSSSQKKNLGLFNRGIRVKDTHLPSTSMPFGTKGTEPVAIIISFAVTTLLDPTFTF